MMGALIRTFVACGLTACWMVTQPSHAAGPQHDVFQRPKPRGLKQQEPESVKTQKASAAPVEWKPGLRAIIRGGGNAWVNVEGRILQVGQEMNGFRLVNVEERRAVFVKDDVRYTLDLPDVRSASRASGSGDTKAVAESRPGGGKAASDAASAAATQADAGNGPPAAAAKAANDPGLAGGAKSVPDSAPGDGRVPADPARLNAIKASAVLHKRDGLAAGVAAASGGELAEAGGR
jgi:hypothetical protein